MTVRVGGNEAADVLSAEKLAEKIRIANYSLSEPRRVQAVKNIVASHELLRCRSDETRKALEEYGSHKHGCEFLKPPGLGRSGTGQVCTCGFTAALSVVQPDGQQT